jgi:hypothetical protein
MGLYYALAFFAFIIGRVALVCEVRSENSLKVYETLSPTYEAELVQHTKFPFVHRSYWINCDSDIFNPVGALAIRLKPTGISCQSNIPLPSRALLTASFDFLVLQQHIREMEVCSQHQHFGHPLISSDIALFATGHDQPGNQPKNEIFLSGTLLYLTSLLPFRVSCAREDGTYALALPTCRRQTFGSMLHSIFHLY